MSRGGLSLSVGVPGARVHIPLGGRRKPGYTLGIPGTGLSMSDRIDPHK